MARLKVPGGIGSETVMKGEEETRDWTHGVEDILLGFGFLSGRRDPRTRVRFPLGPSSPIMPSRAGEIRRDPISCGRYGEKREKKIRVS
jgi:hypothetical protein